MSVSISFIIDMPFGANCLNKIEGCQSDRATSHINSMGDRL